MTDILCEWLNEDVKVEPEISSSSFASELSNGYLFGKVLHQHGLQADFGAFSNGRSSEAKLNNFTRLEPTFRLLNVPFNTCTAREIMTEKPGAAIRIMYHLFIALKKKKKILTGVSLECSKTSAKARLDKVESEQYKEALKQQTPRQVDLNFQALANKFQERHEKHLEVVRKERKQEEERLARERKESCHQTLEKVHKAREKQTQLYAKLKPLTPAATSKQSPKEKVTTPQGLTTSRKTARSLSLAYETLKNIDEFEVKNRHRTTTAPSDIRLSSSDNLNVQGEVHGVTRKSFTAPLPDQYISEIRKRIQDDEIARKEREIRRRRVLVQQMKALQEQEASKRETVLVERLMRQSMQERRVATQLMQIRTEKDSIRNNRIFRQKQYEEQREKEFLDSLNKEAERERQDAEAKKIRLKYHREVRGKLLAEKHQSDHKKHYLICKEVMDGIVDLSTKLAEYRELTENLVPAKLLRDWKTLFLAGKPLYENSSISCKDEVEMHSEVSHDSHQDSEQLLDETDLREYLEAKFEWKSTKLLDVPLPRPVNPFLNHIVHRLSQMADPPTPPANQPHLPHFVLRASFVGKPLTGKSSILDRLHQELRISVLNMEQLVTNAVAIYLEEKKSISQEVVNPETSGQDIHTQEATTNEEPQSHDEEDNEADDTMVASGQTTPLQSSSAAQVGERLQVGGEPDSGAVVSSSMPDEQRNKMKLSTIGSLGEKAYNALICGVAMEDHLMISILMEELRSLPNGSGWVLESFPTTVEQAKLLASALTGQDDPQPRKTHHYVFVTDPQNTEKDIFSASGLDVVFFFDANTDVVLQRAAEMEGDQHLTKLDHIQQSLQTFEENWPRLKGWYKKFKNLVTVDANVLLDALYDQVLSHAKDIVNKAKQDAAMKRIGNPALTFSRNDLSSMSMLDFSFIGSMRDHKRKRRQSSANRSSSKMNGVPTPTPAQASDPLFIPANLNGEPGTSDWQYTCLPLSLDLAKGLSTKWSSVEVCCLTKLKKIFQCLRDEREAVCHYFYLRRNEFTSYLNRPDHKQEFVFQWQQSYNSIADYLRKEETMKVELHHRVDDLCDKLWDICDRRRDEAMQERQRIIEDQWLEDHTSLLTNYYISIMQIELDKFEDAVTLMKDYYCSMEGSVPSKLSEPPRLPLVEHLAPKDPVPPASAQNSSHNITTDQTAPPVVRIDAPSTPRRVPLLPRQPPIEPVAEEKSAKKPPKTAAPPSPQPPTEDISGLGLDEQLVVHTYNLAIAAVFNRMAGEVKAIDQASQEAAKFTKPPLEVVKSEKSADSKEEKGKGNKNEAKEKAPKKGKATPAGKTTPRKPVQEATPVETPAPSITPEEAAKHQRMEHARREFKAALLYEEATVKARLSLIKIKVLEIIGELKEKTASSYAAMEQWLEECYKKEVESVSCLAKVLRQAVEKEEKLMYELILPGTEFKIVESVVLFSPPPPPSPPPVVEASMIDRFTVEQVHELFKQFACTAPNGVMEVDTFVYNMFSLVSRQLGSTLLPDLWCGISKEQVIQVTESLYGKDAEEVDWRRLLVGVAQPWPLPTKEQLLAAMETFSMVEPTYKLTYSQYMSADTWMSEEAKKCTIGYNRVEKLREVFFEIFSDTTTNCVNCKKMLLYLCADPDPQEGLSKALSIAVGVPVDIREVQTLDQTVLFEEFYAVIAHCVSLPKEYVFKLFVKGHPSNPNEANLKILLSHALTEQLDASRAFYLQDLRVIISPPVSTPSEPQDEKADVQDS